LSSSSTTTNNDDPTLLLASDDPSLLSNTEFALATSPLSVQAAQTRIQLATKAALDASSPNHDLHEPGSAYTKHIDENAGWDGGFYPSLFASLGGTTSAASLETGIAVDAQTRKMREYIGRGYLLDLAILGQASDGVVCAVGSSACRILGVMMGWDAVREGRWVNVDDGRAWNWDGRSGR
jgi:hypothetical protein